MNSRYHWMLPTTPQSVFQDLLRPEIASARQTLWWGLPHWLHLMMDLMDNVLNLIDQKSSIEVRKYIPS
ncbi:hypothetical protein ACIOG3_15910 [Yersinia rochesterensis]|uniref:hypothetical protein n=1 Tax=Yersinia rochesterensis TaxID=1604335 RepID=UPI0005712679|nr:hypothetical protein [Yersinia rochesterensis]